MRIAYENILQPSSWLIDCLFYYLVPFHSLVLTLLQKTWFLCMLKEPSWKLIYQVVTTKSGGSIGLLLITSSGKLVYATLIL